MPYVFNPISGQFNFVPALPDNISNIANYSQTFVIADWTLAGDTYSLTIPKSTHNKNNPVAVVYELSGADYIKVETGVRVDSSENIILTVNAVPDLRFDGKISIS